MARQLGWETFKAWVAEGAKDLHNNIVPAFPAYAHGVDEPGTPQNNREPAAEPPSLADRIAAMHEAKAVERESQPEVSPEP